MLCPLLVFVSKVLLTHGMLTHLCYVCTSFPTAAAQWSCDHDCLQGPQKVKYCQAFYSKSSLTPAITCRIIQIRIHNSKGWKSQNTESSKSKIKTQWYCIMTFADQSQHKDQNRQKPYCCLLGNCLINRSTMPTSIAFLPNASAPLWCVW